LLLKQATKQGSLLGAFATPHFMFGAICLVVAGLTITFALKHGDLSVLYPFIALGFIWVAAIGVFVLHEQPSTTQFLGTLLIIGGVSLIGHHGRRA
jgi:drug/metabolite transporter (DMT)-like permease